jgi:hypothetical protein
MIHHRQRLPFRLKPRQHLLGVHAQLDDLERHAAAHRFLLLRHPHHAEAAFADLLQQFVASDAIAGFFRRRPWDTRRLDGHEVARLIMRSEQ